MHINSRFPGQSRVPQSHEFYTKFRVKIVAVLLMMASATGVALAENGRDFAGFFSFTEPSGWNEALTGTLTLEIFNYSGADITYATVRMSQLLPAEFVYESLVPTNIAYRERVVVTDSALVVPRANYEEWMQGTLPIVHIDYTDASGDTRSATVEILPLLVEGALQP